MIEGGRYAARAAAISARNILPARIHSMRDDGATSRIELRLKSGEALVATLARAGAAELGLQPGMAVLAMVKAPWFVFVAGDKAAAGLSSPNRLPGEITRVVPGAVNAELCLRTRGGCELVAVLPRDGVRECGLEVGARATAVVSPADVVIGLPAAAGA